MIEHHNIPITKIISAACRNFMAFRELHTFEFEDGINTIIGGNSSGKTSLISLITYALSPKEDRTWNGQWYPEKELNETLLELKFIAYGKTHFLRRVMMGDTTTDLHLYIGEGVDTYFLRDGEVVEYLFKLKPVFVFDRFEQSPNDFFAHTSVDKANANSLFGQNDELLQELNLLLTIANINVNRIVKTGDEIVAVHQNGRVVKLSWLSGAHSRIIFVLAKILTMLNKIKEEKLSSVILIDELGIGLDRSAIKSLNDAIKEIARRHDCQFMITSTFVSGRINPIRINSFRIPRCYM